jgi:alpha-galactosidase
MVYTPKVMSAWVTDAAGKTFSLEYRFHSSMMGILGIGANLYHWSPQDFKEAKALIAQYKQLRHIIQEGDLYRIESPRSGKICAIEYIAKDKSELVIFAFKDSENFDTSVYYIHPKNLDPIGLYSGTGVMGTLSGKAIMTRGIIVSLSGVYKSTCIHIKRN